EIAQLQLRVTTSPDLRRSLVERGQERANQFTWQETARKTAQIYADVIERPNEVSLFQRSMFWKLLQSGLRFGGWGPARFGANGRDVPPIPGAEIAVSIEGFPESVSSLPR